MPTALQALQDAPVTIVRMGLAFCRQQFDDPVKRGECVAAFSESTSPDELRKKLSCIAGSESTRDEQVCQRELAALPFRDGTTRLEVVLGSDAAEYAREIVAAAEPILLTWEHPEIAPAPAPIAPAPTVVEAVRRRGRPRRIPLGERIVACAPSLPPDLRRLEMALGPVVRDLEDRFPNTTVGQLDELCLQIHDAIVAEPRLQALESCLCPRDRRIRPPSVLDVVRGSTIVQFE